MTIFRFRGFIVLPLLFPLVMMQAADDPAMKPNVVLILADDLGWTDLGCFGSDLYPSPHLDRLAREGMRFTNNYSACTVCSPTRAALMTGKYPARFLPDRALYWHYPHYQHYQQGGTTPYGAIRRGDQKLIEFYDDFRVELYDLANDPGEKNDISAANPDVVRRLRDELHNWRQSVQAQMPTPNPNYDPSKPEHVPTPPKKKSSPKAKT